MKSLEELMAIKAKAEKAMLAREEGNGKRVVWQRAASRQAQGPFSTDL